MVSANRRIIIAGNWKMYKTIPESIRYLRTLLPALIDSPLQPYLAVPFTAIHSAAELCKDTPVVVGAQNMHDAEAGAFTGEIAARMIQDAGARFVILGHSERRRHFHETNAFINKKVKRALDSGLQPILCVGETAKEHEDGQAAAVITKQIREGLEGVTAEQASVLILAYEPVWAIGTSLTASPEIAQKVHSLCRSVLAELFGKEQAEKISIIYGGSVTPATAAGLLEQPDVDGLLVGSASLDADNFLKIIQNPSTKHLNINR